MSFQWDQWAATTVPLLVAIGGGLGHLYLARRKEQKQSEAIRQKEHEENQEKLDAILLDQLYLVPHDHIESRVPSDDGDVPLTRGGIIRRPNGPPTLKRGRVP